ncbi:MAG: metallophosphoesterase [Acinetobacter populi]|jgi:3',5'-cyclic AMP phosphodiesterase CpdA|uniref:metallophosphoesterase family protein n=1 Tax=Acinetobacter populi TaxID=1582270 RepID=UPI002353D55F|nr:metallophosphoesterase [Acinetobacter populi]MCH4247075.1 metallophosphoesterase [Acinetobacter populi]
MLLHLSDLHFGTEQPDRVAAVRQFCLDYQPELIVVSGDLTQRARFHQFYLCKQFLESLQCPYLVVPGNHDIPLYHVWRRFFSPFNRYQLFFGSPENVMQTEHFYVIGVNSIRPSHHTKGYVSTEQILRVTQLLQQAPKHLLKFIVVHQPFYTEPDDKHGSKDCPVLGEIALQHWAKVGLNGLLHGHLHQSAVYHLNQLYQLPGAQDVLDIHAGTALSFRLHHGQQNGFNLIYPDGQIDGFLFNLATQIFEKDQTLWTC